jgi:AAA domain
MTETQQQKKEKGTKNSAPNPVKNQVKDNKKNGEIKKDDLDKDFILQTINKNKPTIKDLLKLAEIDPYKSMNIPPSILSFDDVSFGTLGNFSCLTGKSKSRKTFFLSILIASVLDVNGNFQRIKTEIPNTNVLHFDTEQSEYHTQLVAKRIISLLNDKDTDYTNYKCYCLRPYSPKTRIDIIKEAIYNTSNLKLVVIDGIADLIIGYNNEDEAIKVIGEFMKWTHELKIHIITVVHQNKGDNNAKGHLGSLILQKAETVLSIEKEGEISKVESSHSRGIETPPLSFSIDENGLPYFVDYTHSTTTNNRKKSLPRDHKKEVHHEILKDVFKNQTKLKSSDFSRFLKDTLAGYGIKIGDNFIRDWKTYYETSEMIFKKNQQEPYELSESVS